MLRFLTSSLLALTCFPIQAQEEAAARSTEIIFSLGSEKELKNFTLTPERKKAIESALKNHLQEMTLTAEILTWTEKNDLKLILPPLGEAVRTQAVGDLTKDKIIRYGYLTLHLVHPENQKWIIRMAEDPGVSAPPGYKVMILTDTDDDDTPTQEKLLIQKTPVLGSESIIHAQELYGPHEGKLSVELNKKGATKMFQTTKEMQHGVDRMAIVLDHKVLSAPVVQDSLGAKFEISGMKTHAEAKKIAVALLSPLNKSLKIKSINPPLAK